MTELGGRLAVFRVDASSTVGIGHLLRCRTLAARLAERHWQIGLACSESTLKLKPGFGCDSCRIVTMPADPLQEPSVLSDCWQGGVDVLIIDHYERDFCFEAACRPWARRIVAIDDVPDRCHDVDMLLDQTLGRSTEEYLGKVQESTKLALGADFILMRPEIRLRRRDSIAAPSRVRQIVVTFGGSDVHNLSARALAAFADPRLASVPACLIVGPGNARYDSLRAAAPAHVRLEVDPKDLPEIMATSDLALASAGTSAWELAYLGVPAVLVTESPGSVAQALATVGAARWIGYEECVDAAIIADALVALLDDRYARQAMAISGRRLIDGNGAERAARAIEELCL